MNLRIYISIGLIVIGLSLAVWNFFTTRIEYGSFADARTLQKKIQVKGVWLKDQPLVVSSDYSQTTFKMVDDFGDTATVILKGVVPSNFSIATSIVVKGDYKDSVFIARDILTKCPSKYEHTTTVDK